jgi:hypothetical protein
MCVKKSKGSYSSDNYVIPRLKLQPLIELRLKMTFIVLVFGLLQRRFKTQYECTQAIVQKYRVLRARLIIVLFDPSVHFQPTLALFQFAPSVQLGAWWPRNAFVREMLEVWEHV